jgi:hypothetical protein
MSLQHPQCNKCTKRLICTACDRRSDSFLNDGDAHITFRVRLALSSSTVDDASLYYSENKRLELKLQSAHDTGSSSNNYGGVQDPVELPSSISDFITYIIQKIYVGGKTRSGGGGSGSSNDQYDSKADLQFLRTLVYTYAPDLEEACFLYHIVGDVSSLVKIRQGFRDAEATSSSSTFHVGMCANESADMPIEPNGRIVVNSGGREVIDFILSVNYGDRAGMSEKSKRKVDKVVEVSQVENAQIENVHTDGQQSTCDDSHSAERKKTEEADAPTRYPSKYDWNSF